MRPRYEKCFYCGLIPKAYRSETDYWNIDHHCRFASGIVYIGAETRDQAVEAWNRHRERLIRQLGVALRSIRRKRKRQ